MIAVILYNVNTRPVLSVNHVLRLLLVILFFWLACRPSVRFAADAGSDQQVSAEGVYHEGQTFAGIISYYGREFHGRKTANGETYNMYDKTAAHLYLPFNSILRVTNTQNGKYVIVRINDRGPFKENRILDLSFQAAKEIDLISEGTTQAIIKIIRLGKS
jgi:rare lipoprotein A (peptidoglycan hydrolase)